MIFYTIGVYGSTESEFFNKIINNEIDVFCDIRQRRGVRGSQYAFVNSQRLQKKLQQLKIRYLHFLELAPTKEIRELQKSADAQSGEQKRSRNKLGQVFTIAYKDRILNDFDFDGFLNYLNDINANNVVFFCVEEKPEACHRSLLTDKLANLGYGINHL